MPGAQQQDWWASNMPRVGLDGGQGGQGGGGQPPAGGNLQDPNYVDQLISYYGGLPGADPSLKNDPGYWRQKILSGELGPDQGYIVNKMQTAWQGGGGGGGGAGYNAGNFGGAPNPYQIPNFTTPTPYNAPTFTAPLLNESTDPGLEARRVMGQKTLETGAAAKGSVLSGGTLKALDRYNQDYASNEYGNVYNRALNTFNTNANLGLQGYNVNAANQWRGQENQAQYGLTGYQTNIGAQRNAQQDYWARLQSLYQGGLQAAPYAYQRP